LILHFLAVILAAVRRLVLVVVEGIMQEVEVEVLV
jgi:hypothetical protein